MTARVLFCFCSFAIWLVQTELPHQEPVRSAQIVVCTIGPTKSSAAKMQIQTKTEANLRKVLVGKNSTEEMDSKA